MQKSSDSYLFQNDKSSDFPFGKPPLPLQDYYKEVFDGGTDTLDTLSTAEQLFYSLVLTEDSCSRIEFHTRDQRNSDEWYQQRQGRLTASDFHKVYAMQKQTNPTIYCCKAATI